MAEIVDAAGIRRTKPKQGLADIVGVLAALERQQLDAVARDIDQRRVDTVARCAGHQANHSNSLGGHRLIVSFLNH